MCGTALALGTPVGSAHVAAFIAIAAGWSGLRLWRSRTFPILLLVACLLALVVRSGVIELLTQVWSWPAYAAVVPAAIVTGIVLQRVRNTGADMEWRALLVALVGYAFFLRVLYSAQIDLIPDHRRAKVDINLILFLLFGFCLAGFASVEKLVTLFFVPDHAALGCEYDLIAYPIQRFTNQFFRPSVAIHRSGINQVDSVINCCPNCAFRVVPLGATPHPSSNRPSSKTDDRSLNTRFSQ